MGKFKKIQTSDKRIEAVLVPYNASASTGWNSISGSKVTIYCNTKKSI